jgi:hypothetical protein
MFTRCESTNDISSASLDGGTAALPPPLRNPILISDRAPSITARRLKQYIVTLNSIKVEEGIVAVRPASTIIVATSPAVQPPQPYIPTQPGVVCPSKSARRVKSIIMNGTRGT